MDVFDLVVVGGGILGMSHAAAAASRGLSVALVDRSPQPQGASVRNFGHLTQLYSDGGVWGARADRSREIYATWAARGGVPMTVTGCLQLVQSPAQLTLAAAFAEAVGPAKARLLTPEQARALVPALASAGGGGRILGGLHLLADALLEPRLLAVTLPPFLRDALGVTLVTCDAAVALEPVSVTRGGEGGAGARPGAGAPPAPAGGPPPTSAVVVRTASGRSLLGRHAVLATGDDICGLLPGLLREEAGKLRLCKLQMTRVRLPPGAGPLTMPVTSGLTLRRYPALAAVRPAEFAAMMASDPEGADPSAEALGIHIIARPAPVVPRGPWGELRLDEGWAVAGTDGGPAGSVPLDGHEVIFGDSHQYAPLYGPGAGGLDDVVDEGVTDEMLRVGGTMLDGIARLRAVRRGEDAGAAAGGGGSAGARLLSQWTGVYMQHADGVLNVTVALTAPASSADDGAQRTPYIRLSPAQAAQAVAPSGASCGGGLVHVVTGIGGKGMTMSPALAEENISALFPAAAAAAAAAASAASDKVASAGAAAGQ
jgi:D-hydroxyproline dehydrogenase subunit beta